MDEQYFHDHLERYLDGELDQNGREKMERMIAENPLYAMAMEREREFNGILHKHLIREEAPYKLREHVIDSLRQKQAGFRLPSWLLASLRPVAVASVVVVLFAGLWLGNSAAFPVFTESITRHTECLKGVYSMEIHSSDPYEVAKWFQGKLGFAVNPPDLSSHNAKLVGARLCHLKDKRVAFLTYDYNGRQISAFILDVRDMKIPKSHKLESDEYTVFAKSDMGYQSILCLKKQVYGVGCIFVSDIPQETLIDMII